MTLSRINLLHSTEIEEKINFSKTQKINKWIFVQKSHQKCTLIVPEVIRRQEKVHCSTVQSRKNNLKYRSNSDSLEDCPKMVDNYHKVGVSRNAVKTRHLIINHSEMAMIQNLPKRSKTIGLCIQQNLPFKLMSSICCFGVTWEVQERNLKLRRLRKASLILSSIGRKNRELRKERLSGLR